MKTFKQFVSANDNLPKGDTKAALVNARRGAMRGDEMEKRKAEILAKTIKEGAIGEIILRAAAKERARRMPQNPEVAMLRAAKRENKRRNSSIAATTSAGTALGGAAGAITGTPAGVLGGAALGGALGNYVGKKLYREETLNEKNWEKWWLKKALKKATKNSLEHGKAKSKLNKE
jgi:hypothetical protein